VYDKLIPGLKAALFHDFLPIGGFDVNASMRFGKGYGFTPTVFRLISGCSVYFFTRKTLSIVHSSIVICICIPLNSNRFEVIEEPFVWNFLLLPWTF
jgi:hypothetical protein